MNASFPTANFGGLTTLEVDAKPYKRTFLLFDLTELSGKTITNAVLRLWVDDASGHTQNIKPVNDNNWNEFTLNYNNQPATGPILTSFNGGGRNNWVEIDISNALTQNPNGPFTIAIDSEGNNGISFNSKEAGSEAPQLVVTFN